jgi:uncharacterized membrane protein YccF (DUF307 family)
MKLLARLLWFYFIGWPVGTIWLGVAWFLCVTLIGFPIGLWMIHQAPGIITFKQDGSWEEIEVQGRTAYIFEEMEQPGFLKRALWFLLVGWWLSFLWYTVASACAVTFVFIPVAFWMINRLPWVMTLHRS